MILDNTQQIKDEKFVLDKLERKAILQAKKRNMQRVKKHFSNGMTFTKNNFKYKILNYDFYHAMYRCLNITNNYQHKYFTYDDIKKLI